MAERTASQTSESDYDKAYTEEEFEVEKISDSRRNAKSNKWEFLVHWKKFPDDCTWEPMANLIAYMKMINQFEEEKNAIKAKAKSALLSKQEENRRQKGLDSKQAKKKTLGSKNSREEVQGRLRSDASDSSEKKKRVSFNSFFDEDDDDSDDEDYVDEGSFEEMDEDKVSDILKIDVSGTEKAPAMLDIEGEIDDNHLALQFDEDLDRFKKEFTSKYAVPSVGGVHSFSSYQEEQSTSSTQDMSNVVSSNDKITKQVRRFAKRSKPEKQKQDFMGDFLVDDIAEITKMVTYDYSINWKQQQQQQSRTMTAQQAMSFTKVQQISPDQFISDLSGHYVEQMSKQ